MRYLQRLLPLLLLLSLVACASIKQGADPLVVRAEQSESVAKATFDVILNIDNANRSYFRTSAPSFHAFCELLRKPKMVSQGGTNVISLPTGAAIIWSLDSTKVAYKNSSSYSNALASALATVEQALFEAQSWINNTPTNH